MPPATVQEQSGNEDEVEDADDPQDPGVLPGTQEATDSSGRSYESEPKGQRDQTDAVG